MAETNGSGRLERIEAILKEVAECQRKFAITQDRDHEQHERNFKRNFKQLLSWHARMDEKMDKAREESERERERLDRLSEVTDKQVAELVHSIGDLIKHSR